ncbi:MAG TPA: hypothetical protein VFG65_06260, partial [Fimbriimonadales bacterium]|nr:hypothetical protein [Fimbriimonadales bacterium]
MHPVAGAVWTIDGVVVTGGDTFTAPTAATPYSTIDLEYGVPGQPFIYSTVIFISGQSGTAVRSLPITMRKPAAGDTIDVGPTETVSYHNDGSPDGPPPVLEDSQSCYWVDPGTPLDPPAE